MLENLPGTRNQKIVVISVAVLLIVTYIVYVILSYSSPRDYSLSPTSLSRDSHSLLKDNTLYSYNGLSFLKKDISTGDTTTLATGEDFGTIENLQWVGDRGVLLSIAGGYGPGIVSKAIEREGIELLDTPIDSLWWYYDFKNKSLNQLEQPPDIGTYITTGPDTSRVFYLSTAGSSYEMYGQTANIVSYNLDTKETKDYYIPDDTSFVRYTGDCPGAELCVVLRKSGEQTTTSLLTFSNGEPEELVSTNGVISFTNRPGTVVVTEQRFDSSIATEETEGYTEQEVDYGVMDAYFYNTESKERQTTGFEVSSDDFYTFLDGQPGQHGTYFVAVGSALTQDNTITEFSEADTSVASVRGAYSLLGRVATTSSTIELPENAESLFFPSVVDRFNRLVNDIDATNYYLTEEDNPQLVTRDQDAADIVVEECSSDNDISYEYANEIYEYRILAPYREDGTLPSQITEFSDCVASKSDAGLFIGYSFNFSFTDTESGRIVIP
jgi:hypothetical protein